MATASFQHPLDERPATAGPSPGGRRFRRGGARAGFSLIEALIVLLVAGLALMLVFSIGGQAARTGFALGRRALAAADGEVAEDELRGVIGALALPPAGADPKALRLDPFAGRADGFSADAVLTRAGLCGPAGPAGLVRVAIEQRPDGDLVTCQARGLAPIVVADLRPRRARFAYSADGAGWSDRWSPPPDWAVPRRALAAQTLFIRLATDDGRVEWVERATSGPPWLYASPGPAAPAAPATAR
ncbi:MAG TPA: hypothetical protein VGG29_13645 [Caulobacteraceae bacterium]|jgi:type II secretory pathway pseudopilin PulG